MLIYEDIKVYFSHSSCRTERRIRFKINIQLRPSDVKLTGYRSSFHILLTSCSPRNFRVWTRIK